MTDDEIIAVVQAHKEGKKIQVRSRICGSWAGCENPAWAFDNLDYRVAPEPRKPREWWVMEHIGGSLTVSHIEPNESPCFKVIRVREVIE